MRRKKIFFGSALLLAAVYLPGLSMALRTVDPGALGWTIVITGSLIPWAVGQLTLTWGRLRAG